MTRSSLSEFHNIRRSMQKRLAFYMITLALILAAALVTGLFFFNQLKSPREELVTSLNFRMEAFASDMASLWRNVAVMGIHLSEDMTAIVEEQTPDLSAASWDPDTAERLQGAMLDSLCQYVRQADCSGAFVMLNASLSGDDFRSGLFLQRGNSARMSSDLLLYRGMAGAGRQNHVMPHRKWAQEFRLSDFPGLAEHLNTASAPIDRDCRTTALLTLPGTSERAILLTVPMLGADGTVYGLCGFSINQTYFSAHHIQPSGMSSLACVLSDGADGLDASQSLVTYPADGFCFVPEERLTEKSIREGLTAYSGTESSFVGLSQPFVSRSCRRSGAAYAHRAVSPVHLSRHSAEKRSGDRRTFAAAAVFRRGLLSLLYPPLSAPRHAGHRASQGRGLRRRADDLRRASSRLREAALP